MKIVTSCLHPPPLFSPKEKSQVVQFITVHLWGFSQNLLKGKIALMRVLLKKDLKKEKAEVKVFTSRWGLGYRERFLRHQGSFLILPVRLFSKIKGYALIWSLGMWASHGTGMTAVHEGVVVRDELVLLNLHFKKKNLHFIIFTFF